MATEGDLTVTGSKVAGQNVLLDAARNLTLQSAKETSSQHSTSKSGGGGVGVLVGQSGMGFYVEANASRGKADGDSVTHAETTIDAANTLVLRSGGNTTLQGAQARGEQVIARVGGDLSLISQQDTDHFKSKDQSAGGQVVIGVGSSASVSYNQNKIDSDYKSVTEQTGIAAGKGGFDIELGGTTTLTGAAIASTADAARNRLSTQALVATDLQNSAKYSASSVGGTVGTNGGSPNLGMPQKDDASSTTRSGISAGTLDIRGGDTGAVAKLDRSLTDLQQTGLKPIFDKKEVAETMELGQVASQVGFRAAGDIAARMGWQEGSKEKVILHGVVGAAIAALGGGDALTGVAGAAASQLAFPAIKESLETQGIKEGSSEFNFYLQLAGLAVGAAVGGDSGGSVALAGIQNNYLRHQDVTLLAKKLAKCEADDSQCRDAVVKEAQRISDSNDAALLACRTQTCIDQHVGRIFQGAWIFSSIYNADQAKDNEEKNAFGQISDLETKSLLLAANMAAGLPREREYIDKNCISTFEQGCRERFLAAVKGGVFTRPSDAVGSGWMWMFENYEAAAGGTKQPHEYRDLTLACARGTINECGGPMDQFNAMRRYAGPGTDGGSMVENGTVSKLAIVAHLGYTTHLINPENSSLINITLPGAHALDPGFVIRRIVPDGKGGFFVDTRGWGTGSSPIFNSNAWADGGVWRINTQTIGADALEFKSPFGASTPIMKCENVTLSNGLVKRVCQ
ncbi:hemagglutinin repeat-containing protein [Lysobacter firmicutimachus]|uniref:Hemagglutinin repeat-containing protein n=1 Tax=Lysobacter firmicutimachus TaxID=1792846 RepID=A0AAU8N313_9GAMM